MSVDVLDACDEIVERMTVGGQHSRDAVELGDLVERREEIGERVGARVDAGDVGRDRRQHVVTREQYTALRIEEAQVVWCVTRCVDADPLALAECDRLRVFEPNTRTWRGEP